MGTFLMPVTPTSSASWASHTRRSPKSSEPGTDMFVPIGTPIYAPGDGVVYGSGNTIGPATGRWVGIDLDNGMRFRCMHLSHLVTLSKRVKRGALIGYSGASGYGYEDWSRVSGMPGAHTHVTLWPTQVSRFGYDRNGNPYTVDFMNYVGDSAGGGGSPIAPKIESEEDDMKHLLVDDDGNKRPVWVLLNVKTGRFIPTYSQSQANSWVVPWGNAQKATRQQFLDAIDAIQKTA